MPYQTTLPGIRESVLDKIVAAMQAKIADLNTALGSVSPSLTTALGVTVTNPQFRVGDPDTLPDVSTYPFWVAVVGGGRQDGRDTSFELKSQQGGYWQQMYTNIYFYLHPDALPDTDPVNQAQNRERLRARFTDWLIEDVFNQTGVGSLSLTLGSRVFATAPNFDTLDRCFVHNVSMGYVLKSYGPTQWVYMAHYEHVGEVYAG